MAQNQEFDWESRERIRRSTHGRTQEETRFRPTGYGSEEYVVWRERFGMPALNMPNGHCVFKQHGMKMGVETRLLISGNVDFINGVGELGLRIDVSDSDSEEAYLHEFLEEMKAARLLIKSRLKWLKAKLKKEKR